jgi:hypothetical protein
MHRAACPGRRAPRSDARPSRGRHDGSIRNDPGSAEQRCALHRVRETLIHELLLWR